MIIKIADLEKEILNATESIRREEESNKSFVSIALADTSATVEELETEIKAVFAGDFQIIDDNGAVNNYQAFDLSYITKEMYPTRTTIRIEFNKQSIVE